MNCSCGGENEHCIYCGGLGEVKRRKTSLPTIRARKSKREDTNLLPLLGKLGAPTERAEAKAESATSGRVPSVNCRRCSFVGTRDQLYKHIRDHHPAIPDEPMPTLREGMHCPLCEAPVRRAEFELHLRNVHSTDWNALERMIHSGLKSLYRPPCSLCECKPSFVDMYLHFDVKHHISESNLRKLLSSGVSANPRRKRSQTGRVENPESLNHRRSAGPVVAELNREDTLEAHRQMGFVIRENGRYGSHPLHDRHDDESIP